jgi:hypothetical protein
MKDVTYLLAFSANERFETELYLERWLQLHGAVNVFDNIRLFRSPLKADDISHEIARQDAIAGTISTESLLFWR